VLEFGCGFYSTFTFLNRSVFPALVSLNCIENDVIWLEKVAARAGDDQRLRLKLVAEPLESILEEVPLKTFDLILVDSSTLAEKRAATIRALGMRCDGSTLVVIHDYEINAYRRAAREFPNRFEFPTFNPMTGVMWSSPRTLRAQLKNVRMTIDRHAGKVPLDDVQAWCGVFQQEVHTFEMLKGDELVREAK